MTLIQDWRSRVLIFGPLSPRRGPGQQPGSQSVTLTVSTWTPYTLLVSFPSAHDRLQQPLLRRAAIAKVNLNLIAWFGFSTRSVSTPSLVEIYEEVRAARP